MKPELPILLVDDDASYRVLLRHHLEAQGYQVLEAEDGAQGLRIASERPLRLIILDMVMPNSEGLETISALRRQPAHAKVLAISGAHNAYEYLAMAVLLGADAEMEKIRPISELLTKVRLLAEGGNPDRCSPLRPHGARMAINYSVVTDK